MNLRLITTNYVNVLKWTQLWFERLFREKSNELKARNKLEERLRNRDLGLKSRDLGLKSDKIEDSPQHP